MRRLLLLVVSALAAFAASAQNTPAGGETPGSVVVSENKDLISVDFPNEEIRVVLRNVADLFELNLVVPETLVGRTSVKLRNVTWRQIFEVVLSPVNYTYVEEGNIIKIVGRDQLDQEPTTTEIFILNYARASEILPTISRMVKTDAPVSGSIQVDARSNALVITERPSQLKKIRPIIEQLDVATAQVVIESKFVEITRNLGKDIGIDWSSLGGYRVGFEGPITNQLGASTGGGSSGGTTSPNIATLQNTLRTVFNAEGTVNATFSAAEFGMILNFLESQERVRLVSNPTVVTLNNVEASINIGEEYPIPNYTYNQERGAFEISGFTYKPIGVILKVTPQVNNAGFIKLNLEPTVSSRSGTVSFGGGGGSSAAIPIVTVRTAKTQVSLKNGFTMGIGGLIQETATKGKKSVPVLGEIPLIGGLFKNDSDRTEGRNLVVFITAKTLDTEQPKIEDVFKPELLQSLEPEPAQTP